MSHHQFTSADPALTEAEATILESVHGDCQVTVCFREGFESEIAAVCAEFEVEATPLGRVFSGMWEGGFEWSILLADPLAHHSDNA